MEDLFFSLFFNLVCRADDGGGGGGRLCRASGLGAAKVKPLVLAQSGSAVCWGPQRDLARTACQRQCLSAISVLVPNQGDLLSLPLPRNRKT